MSFLEEEKMKIILPLIMLISFFIPWVYANYDGASIMIFGFGRGRVSILGFSVWGWMWDGGSSIYYLGLIALILTIIYFLFELRDYIPALQVPNAEMISLGTGGLAFLFGLIYGIKAISDIEGATPIPIGFIIFLIVAILSLLPKIKTLTGAGAATTTV